MATTTATLSLTSSDLLSGPLSVSASTTCMQAGTTTGLEKVEMGRGKVTVADGSKSLKLATAAGDDGATKVYLCNKATDPTYYIDVNIHDQRLGRLYAGDWLFMPWSQTDTVAELVMEAEGGSCEYEWAIFKEDETLVAAS
jgi:hypothetical protein|tara:strand:+ start:160 stop:582 length:423 start_codon:yes stop_codon:yes gene_type:complete